MSVKRGRPAQLSSADATAGHHNTDKPHRFPSKQMQLERLDGATWKLFGGAISASTAGLRRENSDQAKQAS
jgi:hypothetical protein